MGAIGVVAVAAIGAVDHFDAPAGAQPDPAGEPLSVSDTGEPLGAPPLNTLPAISDDASIVAFVADLDTGRRVAIRDRVAGTTTFVAEPASTHPAVSGDGCTVAYLVELVPEPPPDTDGSPADDATETTLDAAGDIAGPAGEPVPPVTDVELRVLDRCAATPDAPPASLLLRSVLGVPAVAAPALSTDGTKIVWSTGSSIVRYERFTNLSGVVVYLEDATFDPLADAVDQGVAGGTLVTGATVDVSTDATVVAFVAGPGSDPYLPVPPDVYVWSDDPLDAEPPEVELASMPATADPADDTAPPEFGSSAPALSADGSIVLYESSDTDLAAYGSQPGAVTPFVVMYERGQGSSILAADARRPAISTDGHHAVYERGGVIWTMRWGDGIPFSSVTTGPVLTPVDGVQPTTPSGAVVSEHGRAIVFDSPDGVALTPDDRFHDGTHVWLTLQPEDVSGAPVNLGDVDVPGKRSGRATITNWGPSSFAIESVAVDDPVSISATDCAGVLHPGQACTVDVVADVAEVGPVEAPIRVTGGTPPGEVLVLVNANGIDPAATSTTTSTTPSSSSTSTSTSSTSSTSTVPRVTIPPRNTTPRTTTPRTTTPRTTTPRTTVPRTTVPRTTTPSQPSPPATTTTTLPVPPVFNPATFEFAPTIIGAGRRTATVDLFNPAQQAVTLLSIGVTPGADGAGFSADSAACEATALGAGGICPVALEFAPTVVGAHTATVVADFSDGSRATLAVSGVGAPPPTLTITPEVAAQGQVVAVEGAGFPAGGIVVMTWFDAALVWTFTVDGSGGFVETVVVPRRLTGGITQFVVAGQVDVFGDVTADLLVSTGGGASVVVFGGLGPSMAR